MNKNLKVVYFSPTGGTKKVALAVGQGVSSQLETFDMLRHQGEGMKCDSSDSFLFAAPVYAGRLPQYVVKFIETLNGNGANAAAIVVYGNRAYDDALLEMSDALKEQGFKLGAGVAAIAQHTFSPNVANGRPDNMDMQELESFGKAIATQFEKDECTAHSFPGNHPYKEVSSNEFSSLVNGKCISCGRCVSICPTQAISPEDYTVKAKEKCILCKACITVCPAGARSLPAQYEKNIQEKLAPLEGIRKPNELML